MDTHPEVLYRYSMRNYNEEFTPQIEHKEYKVISTTPCGYWIHAWGSYGPKKFVLSGTGKRFAYPTKEMALTAFIYRRRYYQRMLERLVVGNPMVIHKALQLQESMKLESEATND